MQRRDGESEDKIVYPGSPQAQRQGCECAVWDNHYGHGVIHDGETYFYVNENCPLHGSDNK